MTDILITKPSYLAAASLFVAEDCTRYYLQGVFVTPSPDGGILLVATDGYRLVVFRDENGRTDNDYIIPVSKNLFKASKFKHCRTSNKITIIDEILSITDGKSPPTFLEAFAPIDGQYPDYPRTIPAIPDELKVENIARFNARYMGDFAKVIQAAYGKMSSCGITLFQSGNYCPAFIRSDEVDWFGVLMSIKIEEQIKPTPQFTIPKAAVKKDEVA